MLLGENEKERSDTVSSSTRSDRKPTVEKKNDKKFSRERKRAVQSRLDEFRFIRKSLCGAHIFWHITDHKLKRKKFEQRTSQTSQ